MVSQVVHFAELMDREPDLAPVFYPVLGSLRQFLKCTPILGQRELEFSGVMAQFGRGADEPFMSDIGTLLPIALCRRNSL